MFDTTESQTRLTKLAWGTAFATLVIGQLHALARHRTEDGKSDLDLPATVVLGRARGPGPRPAAQLGRPRHRLPGLRQVVDLRARRRGRGRLHGDAAARAVRRRALGLADHAGRLRPARPRRRQPSTGGSGPPTTSWRTSGSGWTSPAHCCRFVGATVLGIALLRRGARPKLAAVLLLLTIPRCSRSPWSPRSATPTSRPCSPSRCSPAPRPGRSRPSAPGCRPRRSRRHNERVTDTRSSSTPGRAGRRRRGRGLPARAVLRPGLRLRADPGHRLHGARSLDGLEGASAAS